MVLVSIVETETVVAVKGVNFQTGMLANTVPLEHRKIKLRHTATFLRSLHFIITSRCDPCYIKHQAIRVQSAERQTLV